MGSESFRIENSAGETHEVVSIQEGVDAGAHDGDAWFPTLKQLRTTDGRAVNVRNGVYEVVGLRGEFRRVKN